MITERDLDTNPATNPWFAAMDAQRRNGEARSTYTAKQRAKAQTAFDLIDTVYESKEMFLTYRKTFVTIKIEEPIVRCGMKTMLKNLEDMFDAQGAYKVNTDQGIIYRIPRDGLV